LNASEGFEIDAVALSQFVKLSLHRRSLRLHDTELVSRGFVPAFAGGPHFSQLLVEDKVSGHANAHCDHCQRSDDPGGPGRTPGRSIYGGLMLLVGAALLAITLESTDAPTNPPWLICWAWTLGIAAAILVCQGTILLLTGEWLL
jgi:hypothetical protein